MAIGAKRIETRSWATTYRGPLAIHASKGFPRWARETCFEKPFYDVLRQADLIYPDSELGFGDERFLMPLGAIVAVARLVSCVPTQEIEAFYRRLTGFDLLPHERDFGDYATGRWAWVLSDVRQLSPSIPCRGALGLWAVPDDLVAGSDGFRSFGSGTPAILHGWKGVL